MKAWSVQAGTAKRLVAAAAAGATALTLLGGCGMATRQQAAAVVNGNPINESDVKETVAQLSAAKYDFSDKSVVIGLIAAPLLKEVVDKSGSWKPDAVYAGVINAIPDATDTTKQLVAAVALLNSSAMTPQDVAAYRNDLKKAKITVNPRFGTLVPSEEGPLFFSLGDSAPNWIQPAPAVK